MGVCGEYNPLWLVCGGSTSLRCVGDSREDFAGKYFSSSVSPLGRVKAISIRRLCLEWLVCGHEQLHAEMQMDMLDAGPGREKKQALIWTNRRICVKYQLFGFSSEIWIGLGNMSLEKQAEETEAGPTAHQAQTETGIFTSQPASLSQHMHSQLRLAPCALLTETKPPPHLKCAHAHTHTNSVLVSPHGWMDKRQLFLTLLVTRALDQSHWAAQCLEGPFLPCCAEMKPTRLAWQGN